MSSKANFQKSLMTSEFDGSKLTTGRFYDADEAAECIDGAFVVIGDLEESSVYSGLKDPNVHKVTAPEAANAKNIAVVDYVGVPGGMINGVLYREGNKLYGMTAPAGADLRVRKLGLGDKFYLSTGNFATAVGNNEFAVPTAGSTQLTPVAAEDDEKLCIKIHFAQPVVEGMVNSDIQYFCEVVNLI